jgi:hypothetical protein
MIKFCRDYVNEAGVVEFVVDEVANLDAESEDLMVRRNYADWHVMVEDAAPVVSDNAAVEGDEA